MKTRLISGIIGSLCVAVMLILGQFFPILYNILVAAVALICSFEILAAAGMTKKLELMIPSLIFSGLFPLLLSLGHWELLAFIYPLAMFVILLVSSERVSFQDLAYTFTTVCVITFGLSTIIVLCGKNLSHALYYIMLAVGIAWIADAGAYFAGSFFGKHKLCPNISPKKTVEGAVGGLLAGVIGAVIISLIFQLFCFQNGEVVLYPQLVLMALIGTAVSIVGDLSFSAIKRSCHIKDYGSIIPGHGGILDRCDSVIFTSPFILIFTVYFPIISL